MVIKKKIKKRRHQNYFNLGGNTDDIKKFYSPELALSRLLILPSPCLIGPLTDGKDLPCCLSYLEATSWLAHLFFFSWDILKVNKSNILHTIKNWILLILWYLFLCSISIYYWIVSVLPYLYTMLWLYHSLFKLSNQISQFTASKYYAPLLGGE